MNKKRVEKLIPKAVELIPKAGILKSGVVPNVFIGYISSFGASIVQSGLYPSILFFQNKNSSVEEDREKLMFSIRCLLEEVDEEIFEKRKIIKKLSKSEKRDLQNKCSLYEYCINCYEDKRELKEKILDAAIAIKLGLRLFEIEK